MWDGQTVPHLKTALPGPRAKVFLERDERVVSPSYTRGYPLVAHKGSGAVVEDVDGNLFLDFTAGIAVTATGHCHPYVVESIRAQAATLLHMSGTDFYYEPQLLLAERLAHVAPGSSPKKVFFTNSGTEAIEAAMKLARYHTGRSKLIGFFGSFHGRTYGAMSLSASKLVHRRRMGPLVPDIFHAPFPRDCSSCTTAAACACAESLESTLLKRVAPPDEVAAIFVEPIQGEGGYHVAPRPFIQALRSLCDRHGILLVFDEIQSGMGRTGKLFAAELFGVEPDILCTAKGIASGLPLGAIIARADVMSWPSGSHASTFGGNPVSCQAALATLDVIEHSGLMDNAVARGTQLHAGLNELAARYPHLLTQARGPGLMVACDVRPNGQTGVSARDAIVDACFAKGLLLLGCGEHGIRFCGPLCVTEEQVAKALELFGEVVAAFAAP
ncbi:MAG TPA: acetyl ornithine aminotransferase family protein [Gemmatales bacterium]|nr:acetyl ornithine aminotransferase family protein [Gemmatales bacterium]